MKIELIGKIRYSESNLYKVTYDKPTKYFCEHCREKKGKISFIEVHNKVENPKPGDGVGWCKICADCCDVGEDTPKNNFKKGQKVYYIGWCDNKVYCEFLYAMSDKYAVVEITREDKSKYELNLEFDYIFSDESEH